MKRIIIFFVLSFIASAASFAQKEIFVKSIEFQLDRISDKDYENEYFLTIKFNKGSVYKFVVTNNINNFPGEAEFKLLDGDNLVLTNKFGDKLFPKFSFQCNKTGFYDILIQFPDGKTGFSKVDIFLMQ